MAAALLAAAHVCVQDILQRDSPRSRRPRVCERVHCPPRVERRTGEKAINHSKFLQMLQLQLVPLTEEDFESQVSSMFVHLRDVLRADNCGDVYRVAMGKDGPRASCDSRWRRTTLSRGVQTTSRLATSATAGRASARSALSSRQAPASARAPSTSGRRARSGRHS